MKTIGLIGGMSWESTLLYYQAINREVSRRLGGLHSARIVLHSVDFEDVVRRQRAADWDGLAQQLRSAAEGLVLAGADALVICTNTMHKVAEAVAAGLSVPLLHIADVTGHAIAAQGCKRVTLLGTRYTMEQTFYTDHLARMGIDCNVPPPAQRDEVHRIIFEELCLGQVLPASRAALQAMVAEAAAQHGSQGVILGCTELSMILATSDLDQPLFDTTALHAQAAADFALADSPALASAD